MRALSYHGIRDVRVESVPDPVIQEPDDVILRVTATAICGSDLHLYRGKIPATEQGDIFGHEFMGIVEDVGPEVSSVKDRKSTRLNSSHVKVSYRVFWLKKKNR